MAAGALAFGQSGTLALGASQIGNGLSSGLGNALYLAGIAWNLPNTAIGLALGTIGYVLGNIDYFIGQSETRPTISFGNNAIQFMNNPFMFWGVITLGNAINYNSQIGPNRIDPDNSPWTFGDHERPHTYQGMLLGPFYLPAYLGGMIAVLFQGSFNVFGYQHFMEHGPYYPRLYNLPPRPWGRPRP